MHFLLTLLFVSVISTPQAPQQAAPNAKRGGELYLKYGCWECHGYTAATGQGATLVTTSLNATGFMNYIRAPRTNQMPLYSAKVVSDADAADLYAFIKSFKKPAEAKEIPLLQQIMNEK